MFRNPVYGPRIVPFGQPRKSTDVMKNGHPAFRVTQSFNHFDAIFRNKIHGAMDIGNFHCGDNVLAMRAGVVSLMQDPNGALGVRVSHSNGYHTEVWHLARFAKNIQTGTVVKAGRIIGMVGSTGLDIGGCHAHVVCISPAGIPVDVWPLLNQNR